MDFHGASYLFETKFGIALDKYISKNLKKQFSGCQVVAEKIILIYFARNLQTQSRTSNLTRVEFALELLPVPKWNFADETSKY